MTFDKIKEIIIEELGVEDEDSITPETSLMDDLEADSLDAVNIMMEIEDTFDVEIPDEETATFKNIGDIAKYVDSVK